MHFKYSGREPVPVVMFFSGGASSIDALYKNTGHGRDYRIVGAVTNRKEEKAPKGYKVAREAGVQPVFINPFEFKKPEEFYREILRKVDEIGPAVIGLSGWLKKFSIVAEPLLGSQYPILNVHPADLTVMIPEIGLSALEMEANLVQRYRMELRALDAVSVSPQECRRAFKGKDAVTTAVLCGEKEVCSTIHSVIRELDSGPIAVQSVRLPVDTGKVEALLRDNAAGDIVAYAGQLQDEMKAKCDGPAFCKAMELLGQGRLELLDDGVALDGKKLPYGGYQM
jgi:folate-dependent phosphoribosylglycinamide formyltransferase PurN